RTVAPDLLLGVDVAARGKGVVGDRLRTHHHLPLRPLGVGDVDGERRAERYTVADPAEERDVVLLEAHPGTAAVAEPASGQGLLQVDPAHLDPCRQALDRGDEGRAVRLTGGQPTQHAGILSRAARGTSA